MKNLNANMDNTTQTCRRAPKRSCATSSVDEPATKRRTIGTQPHMPTRGGMEVRPGPSNINLNRDDNINHNLNQNITHREADGCSLRLLQINLEKSRTATADLKVQMNAGKYDLILIQEPWIVSGRVAGLGVSCQIAVGGPSEDRLMAAIALVNKNLTMVKLAQLCNEHFVCVHVTGAFGSIYLVSGYFGCSYSRRLEDIIPYVSNLRSILNSLRNEKILVAADVNCKSAMWGGRATDDQGDELEELITEFRLKVLNSSDEPPTWACSGKESNVDVTLVSPNIYNKVEHWKVHVGLISSDHRAIETELQFETQANPNWERHRFEATRFNIRKADWENFDSVLASRKRELMELPVNSGEEVNHFAEKISETLVLACNQSIPKRKSVKRKIAWYTPKLRKLKSQKAKVERSLNAEKKKNGYQSPRARELRASLSNYKRTYKKEIRRSQQISYQKFVSDHGNDNPWGIVYKIATDRARVDHGLSTVRKASNINQNERDQNNAVEDHTRGLTDTAQELLNALIPDDDPNDETFEHILIRRAAARPRSREDAEDFSDEEIFDALLSLKNNKAPGQDLIEVKVLKQSYQTLDEVYEKLFNGCLRFGTFPNIWKVGQVVVLKKGGGKDETEPKSFRPICLLPTLGKWLEKIISIRLRPFFDHPEHASRAQYGFKSGRSTEDAIVHLKELLSDRDPRTRQYKYTLALSLDISGAFDNVWWPSVLSNLNTRGCPRNLFLLVNNYFENREVEMSPKYGETNHTARKVATKGCPQGSILGPNFWDTTMDKLLITHERNNQFIEPIAYADDEFVVIWGNSRVEVQNRGQQVIDEALEWCKREKLSLSAKKTNQMWLRGKLDPKRPPTIKIGDKTIPMVQSTKYLGVTIGKGLDVSKHIEDMSAKSLRQFGALRRITGSKWGLSDRSLNIYYKGLFIPTATYAGAAWEDLIKARSRRLLIRTQRKILLACTRAYSTTSTDGLQVLAGRMPVDLEIAQWRYLYNLRKGRGFRLGDNIIYNPETMNDLEGNPPVELKKAINDYFMRQWQNRWEASTKGRTTFEYFPNVQQRVKAKWIRLNHHVSQFLSGHGDFNAKLATFSLKDTSLCFCDEPETPDHLLYDCCMYEKERRELRESVQKAGGAWPPTKLQLVSKKIFPAFARFTTNVLLKKEKERLQELHGER